MPNVPPVKKTAFDPPTLVTRFESAGRAAGFRLDRFGEHAGTPLVALTKRTLGRQALTGLPLAAVQLVKQGGAKEVRGVHGVG